MKVFIFHFLKDSFCDELPGIETNKSEFRQADHAVFLIISKRPLPPVTALDNQKLCISQLQA